MNVVDLRRYWLRNRRTASTDSATDRFSVRVRGVPGDAFEHATVQVVLDLARKLSRTYSYQDGDDLFVRTYAGTGGHELVAYGVERVPTEELFGAYN